MREFDRLFKRYYNENSPTLKVAKHNKYKNALSYVQIQKNRKKNINKLIF